MIVRLDATKSAWRTSLYGVQKAAELETHPFLAFRALGTDLGLRDKVHPYFPDIPIEGSPRMFIVSPLKPKGLYKDCYLTLGGPEDERTLQLVPSLPIEQTLYLHTLPMIFESVPDKTKEAKQLHTPFLIVSLMKTSPAFAIKCWETWKRG